MIAIKYAENERDRAHVVFGKAVGGQVSVAGGSGIEDRPVFSAAIVPTPERAESQPVALRVIGQLADLGAYAWPGGRYQGMVESTMGSSKPRLIADFLVVLHLRHVTLKRGEVGRGESRHSDADRDRLKSKARDRDLPKVRGRQGCDPHLPVGRGDHEPLALKKPQGLPEWCT